MISKQIVFSLFCSLIALAFTGCTTTHVQKLHMAASESPEVHGPNTFQKQNSVSLRATGKINVNPKKNVRFFPEESSEERKDVDWLYKMGGVDFTGSADFFYKASEVYFGTGVGYKDGIFHYFMFGENFAIFEYGFFFGLYHQYGRLDYEGEHCDTDLFGNETCTPFSDKRKDFYSGVLVGGLAGLYFNEVFLNYTWSIYEPFPDVDGTSVGISEIHSHYFTLGYRFNNFEVSAGVIATFAESGFISVGFSSGLSFYLL
ncbi:MAG: hypothetical protein IKS97_02255 [Fibrobacter sp.]|nr:hypothetical protein [Fibrobacter sp.]